MKSTRIASALGILTVLGSCTAPPDSRAVAGGQNTYVVVVGAWGGGFAAKPLDSALSARGHDVYRPTLTGLGERVHLAKPDVDLSTHIEDIVNMIVFEDLEDVVLVGHSYGGMVLPGVADRIPERIRCLIFIDAFLPEDGESLVAAARGSRTGEFARQLVATARDGLIAPPEPVSPGAVPQPVRTFTEPLALRNPAARAIPGKYILTVEAGTDEANDDFASFAARAKARGWPVVVMAGGHVPVGDEWDELARLLGDLPE